jgi:anti-sigma B factor antagonist
MSDEDFDVEHFRVEVAQRHDHVRVSPVGEVDMSTADEVRAEVDRVREAGFTSVVLDLRSTLFMDSTGLRLVLDLDTAARDGGWELAIVPGPRSVQRVFEVTRAVDRLRFVEP